MRSKVIIVLAALSMLSPSAAFAWDDKSINSNTLNKVCEAGVQMNNLKAMSGKEASGFMRFTMQGRVFAGNMTASDYSRLQRWFRTNCPDGW